MKTSDPLAVGAQPAAPATQEPTSDPEGAATYDPEKAFAHLLELGKSPTVTEAAKEIERVLWEESSIPALETRMQKYTTILSRLLGNTEAERRKLREEATKSSAEAERWRNVAKSYDDSPSRKFHEEFKQMRGELRKLREERDTWRSSALLYHSELRDLAEGKKVETNLAFPVEKMIRDLRSQLESSQAECAAVRVCFAEASHNAGPAFVAHERLASLEAECERLRKLLGELRDVTQSLVKLAEVWTPRVHADNSQRQMCH